MFVHVRKKGNYLFASRECERILAQAPVGPVQST